MQLFRLGAALALTLLIQASAMAGEWHAERLRGVVLTMLGDQWHPVAIGDTINDNRVIRTGANGHLTLRSGPQTVELRPNTQIQISSLAGRDHTWVLSTAE